MHDPTTIIIKYHESFLSTRDRIIDACTNKLHGEKDWLAASLAGGRYFWVVGYAPWKLTYKTSSVLAAT
jgi:hypothetical protein